MRRTNEGKGGIELFHADVDEETIRIKGEEEKISPRIINVKIILWDVDKKTGEVRIDPKTGKPKTLTIISNKQYMKSVDIEKSVVIIKSGEHVILTIKKKEESSSHSP